jgi:hypothetical protein
MYQARSLCSSATATRYRLLRLRLPVLSCSLSLSLSLSHTHTHTHTLCLCIFSLSSLALSLSLFLFLLLAICVRCVCVCVCMCVFVCVCLCVCVCDKLDKLTLFVLMDIWGTSCIHVYMYIYISIYVYHISIISQRHTVPLMCMLRQSTCAKGRESRAPPLEERERAWGRVHKSRKQVQSYSCAQTHHARSPSRVVSQVRKEALMLRG